MAAEDWIDHCDSWAELPVEPCGRVRSKVPWAQPSEAAPRSGTSWTKQEDAQLALMFRNHYSISQMAKELGRTTLGIEYRLNNSGITTRKPGTWGDLSTSARNHDQASTKKSTEKAPNIMHTELQHLIALLQKNYTTVNVRFHTNGTAYTYKVPNSVAATLAEGDQVVVPTGDGDGGVNLKVAHVIEVHAEPQIDVSKPLALRWVVQKVDRAAYDDQTKREKEAIEFIERSRRKQAQQEALQTLLGTVEDRAAFLQLINGEAA